MRKAYPILSTTMHVLGGEKIKKKKMLEKKDSTSNTMGLLFVKQISLYYSHSINHFFWHSASRQYQYGTLPGKN